MSGAIGPGDLVVCERNRLPTTQPPVGLVVGRIYRVEAVGYTDAEDAHPHQPWVRLRECPPRPGKLGFRAEWFRPVKGDATSLIQQLSQPLDADVPAFDCDDLGEKNLSTISADSGGRG